LSLLSRVRGRQERGRKKKRKKKVRKGGEKKDTPPEIHFYLQRVRSERKNARETKKEEEKKEEYRHLKKDSPLTGRLRNDAKRRRVEGKREFRQRWTSRHLFLKKPSVSNNGDERGVKGKGKRGGITEVMLE